MEKKELKELLNGIIGEAPLDEDKIKEEIEKEVRNEFEERYKGKIQYLEDTVNSSKELLKFYRNKCKRLEEEKPMWTQNDADRYRELCVKLKKDNDSLKRLLEMERKL